MKLVWNRLNLWISIQDPHRAFHCYFCTDFHWTFHSLYLCFTINLKLCRDRYLRARCMWRNETCVVEMAIIYLEVQMGRRERQWHQINAIHPWRTSLHPVSTGCASTLLETGNGSWVQTWSLWPDPLARSQVPWPEPWKSIPVQLYQIGLFHVCCLCLKRIPCPRWENLHSLEHHCARRCGRFHVSLEVNHRESATGQGMVLWRKLLGAFSGSISESFFYVTLGLSVLWY